MNDIEKVDLNKVLEDTHAKMIEISNNSLTPIGRYEVETFKRLDDIFFNIKIEVIPGKTSEPPYIWWQNFLLELELVRDGHQTIDKLIEKYKKRLLII